MKTIAQFLLSMAVGYYVLPYVVLALVWVMS